MKKASKFFGVLLVMAIVLSAAGCGGNAGSTETGSAGGNTQKSNTAATQQELKKATISVLMHGVSQMTGVQDDPVTKEIEKLTGISIDVMSDSGMDLTTQLNALIASDDLPDIVVGITPEQRNVLLGADAVIPLDDLLAARGSEIASKGAGRFAVEFSKKYYSKDGKLYFIPVRAGVDYQAGFPTVAPYIRWDLYKAMGEPEVKTMDDLLNVLKQMQDKFPKTADGKKTYAMSGCLADPGWNTFSLTAAEAFIGFRKLDNYGLVGTNIFALDRYVNGMESADSPTWKLFKYFNKARQMGILDPDTVTMKYDQWAEKIMAGQVFYVPFGWFATVPIDKDPGKIFLPIKFENFENDAFTSSYAYSQGQCPYAISKKCKNPERAMDLLNFVWSYDGAYLLSNGVKGESWDMVDGKPQMKDEYVRQLKAGEAKGPLFTAFAGPFMDERTDTPITLANSEEYFKQYNSSGMVKEYCDKYGVNAPIENFKKAKYHTWDEVWQYGLKPYEGELKEIDNKIKEYVLNNMPKIVLAKSDAEFEQMRVKIVKDVNSMGAQKLTDFRKPDYDAYISEILKLTEN